MLVWISHGQRSITMTFVLVSDRRPSGPPKIFVSDTEEADYQLTLTEPSISAHLDTTEWKILTEGQG